MYVLLLYMCMYKYGAYIGIVVQDPYSGEVKKKQKDSVAECKQRIKPFLVCIMYMHEVVLPPWTQI